MLILVTCEFFLLVTEVCNSGFHFGFDLGVSIEFDVLLFDELLPLLNLLPVDFAFVLFGCDVLSDRFLVSLRT